MTLLALFIVSGFGVGMLTAVFVRLVGSHKK